MRNADDCNEMEPFDLADEGATVSFVKSRQPKSRRTSSRELWLFAQQPSQWTTHLLVEVYSNKSSRQAGDLFLFYHFFLELAIPPIVLGFQILKKPFDIVHQIHNQICMVFGPW